MLTPPFYAHMISALMGLAENKVCVALEVVINQSIGKDICSRAYHSISNLLRINCICFIIQICDSFQLGWVLRAITCGGCVADLAHVIR